MAGRILVENRPVTDISGIAGALFSPCRRWRYLLWRRWNAGAETVNFVMLNPSTADEFVLDPTCARARSYAERWGYGALVVTNLFAWRATEPERLKRARHPVGEANDGAIVRAARKAALVVCAWGNHGAHRGRAAHVLELLSAARVRLHVLRMNGGGEPAHPLYLRGRLKPKRWM
jgi:hypothetical protein